MKANYHQYSCDTNDRRMIHVYLTILSILFAYLLFWITENTKLKIPWWLDAPAIFGFYGLLYFWFKKALWKLNFFRIIFFIKTPNWNGDYNCALRTSFDEFSTEKQIKIKIIQDWDTIIVRLETENSVSNSISGSFSLKDSFMPEFTYEYLNEPNTMAPETMNMHNGMAKIRIENKLLKGDFFSGRGRKNYGTFNETEG